MSGEFIHTGIFVVKPESGKLFVKVMKDYEGSVAQEGLVESHLVELDSKPNNYRYITIWNSKSDWEAVEKLDAHRNMHKNRDPLLAEEAKTNEGTLVM